MVGIKDVAKKAGVSVGTVSHFINGRQRKMSEETRQRVSDAISQLKYVPNATARQLKSGHSKTLGLIVPSVANPFWGTVSHLVEHAALKHGYKVLVCNAERDPKKENQYVESLFASAVRGVILSSSPLSFDHLREMAKRGMKIAAFDRKSRGAQGTVACSISINQELGGQLAGQHLIGLGHKKVAFVSGPILTASRIGRLEGLKTAMQRAGLEIPENHIWENSSFGGFGDAAGSEIGRIAARELLTQDDPPTALFAINDMYALGAYAGARDLGYRIPEDLSIVGFDDILFAEIVQPSLTTIRQPVVEMSDLIVKALIYSLEGKVADNETPPELHMDLSPRLIVRASTTVAPDR